VKNVSLTITIVVSYYLLVTAFSAFTLLVGQQGGHPPILKRIGFKTTRNLAVNWLNGRGTARSTMWIYEEFVLCREDAQCSG